MRNRHMIALLLGVAPIVAIGQLATAQPTNSTMNDATMNDAAANHQGMDHSLMNQAAPSPNEAEATNAMDADPTVDSAIVTNTGDDPRPK